MLRKAGTALVVFGSVLILSALFLFLYNRHEDVTAGQVAQSQLTELEAAISLRTDASDAQAKALPVETTLEAELPVVELDGYGYIGYLDIPILELRLPVMSEWDYDRLKLAPCRQFGSSRTDDLVIAAHNYNQHFGRLKNLLVGDTLTFTDMEGLVNSYVVQQVSTIAPTAVEAVQNSGYDLVLYSCTKDGQARVGVFCERVQ